jgi:protein TonB
VQTAAVQKEMTVPQVSGESAQPLTKAMQSFPATKADYGWLIASIASRLAEVKHYPATARLHGEEGKVVLRAVIRADGNLAEVKVQKSSGHEDLDVAAMEALRQACPIHMRHELGRPYITVNVPVVYALTH